MGLMLDQGSVRLLRLFARHLPDALGNARVQVVINL
jgi:hypothetical protein